MKRQTVISLLALLILPGCGIAPLPVPKTARPTESPQFGVNFIRYNESSTDKIYSDFNNLGVQTFRQLTSSDIGWKNVEPQKGQWNFGASDEAITKSPVEPIVTLFSLQYSSATPPWATAADPFEKEVGPDAREYVETIVKRYKDYVKYWEIGNEMDHWRAVDPGATKRGPADKLPATLPKDGFSPEEQGKFLAEVATIIKANDPDAIIVMPGMSGLDDYTYGTWLPGMISGAGKNTFDVINYHFYSPWYQLQAARAKFQTELKTLGLADKPIWLTETGSTSSSSLTIRTNYPNSENTQASDVFRRALISFASGDQVVLWHTYISSPSAPANDWRDYGIINSDGTKKPAYYTFKLFADELLPISSVEAIEQSPGGINAFKITHPDGTAHYVAWGKGSWGVPNDTSLVTKILPEINNEYQWMAVPSSITLSDVPVIVK